MDKETKKITIGVDFGTLGKEFSTVTKDSEKCIELGGREGIYHPSSCSLEEAIHIVRARQSDREAFRRALLLALACEYSTGLLSFREHGERVFRIEPLPILPELKLTESWSNPKEFEPHAGSKFIERPRNNFKKR